MFTENLIINKFSVVCGLQSPAMCAVQIWLILANTFSSLVVGKFRLQF